MQDLDVKKIAEKPVAAGDTVIAVDKDGFVKRVKSEDLAVGVEETQADNMPISSIIMWGGETTNIPKGWEIADGRLYTYKNGATSNTRDLRGRFLVGFGETGADVPTNVWDNRYTSPRYTGGNREKSLVLAEMPRHRHTIRGGRGVSGSGSTSDDHRLQDYTTVLPSASTNRQSSYTGGTITTENAEDGRAFDNRPPYYVMIFIQKMENL